MTPHPTSSQRGRAREQPRIELSPLDEIRFVELQCERCFQIEALDMRTTHGGEDIDKQATTEPVDVLAVDEPPLGVEDNILGDF